MSAASLHRITRLPDGFPRSLTIKADAGAQFAHKPTSAWTWILLGDYMKHLVAAGLPRRLNIFPKIAVFSSAADARWLRDAPAK